jgi:hypothetical protein
LIDARIGRLLLLEVAMSRPAYSTALARLLLLSIVLHSSIGCAVTNARWSTAPQAGAVKRAQPSPGDWRQVEVLQVRTPIVITLETGSRVAGIFKSLKPETISIIVGDGTELNVPRHEISTIVATGVKDGLTNGVLIGAGLGAAAAVVILSAIGSRDGYVLPSAKTGAPLLLSSLGGLVGGLVDRAHQSERLVYRAAPARVARD